MESWIFLSITYGLFCGVSDLIKKQTLFHVPVTQTLIFFNLTILIILIFKGGNYELCFNNYWLILLKSFCVFLGWLTGFKAIKLMDISLYSIIMLSKVIFSSVLSIVFLGETLTKNKIVGFIIISVGIIISNFNKSKNKTNFKSIMLVLTSSFFISISLFLDKVILTGSSSFTLQFYYTLTLIIFYLFYINFKKEKLVFNYVKNNYGVINLGIITFIADYIHFLAASSVNSSVVIMTLLRHSSLIVTVLIGSLVFKEKRLKQKIISVIFVVLGIILTIV